MRIEADSLYARSYETARAEASLRHAARNADASDLRQAEPQSASASRARRGGSAWLSSTAAGGRAGSAAPGGPPAVDRRSRLYQVCQDFESIFIKQMLNVMRQTVPKGDLLHGGFAEEIFEDMLYDEYANKMAQTAGFGLSDLLYRQLSAPGSPGEP
jgi:hypothetical protein